MRITTLGSRAIAQARRPRGVPAFKASRSSLREPGTAISHGVHRRQTGRLEPVPPFAAAQDGLGVVDPEPRGIAAGAVDSRLQIAPEVERRPMDFRSDQPRPSYRQPRPSSPSDPDSARSQLRRFQPSAMSHDLPCTSITYPRVIVEQLRIRWALTGFEFLTARLFGGRYH